MSTTVSVGEATKDFSLLLSRVGMGEEIVIEDEGTPVARLIRADSRSGQRTPGSARGLVRISDDFDEPLPEETLELFER